MSRSEQGADSDRYHVIPRAAVFLRQGDAYLLLKGAPTKRLWANKYNGIGGHIERGEDVLGSALRELREETGLDANLWLCGTVIVDTGPVGVGLFVLSGEPTGGILRASTEGVPEWVPYERLTEIPAPDDLRPLLRRLHRMRRGDSPFMARSFYDDAGRLQILFSDQGSDSLDGSGPDTSAAGFRGS